MMGSWRLFLAACVAVSHLWSDMIHGPAAYAVWGFYVLSGFLMTLILNEKYEIGMRGKLRYAENRILRIFPQYVIALVMGVIFFRICEMRGIDTNQLNPEAGVPANGMDFLWNLFLNPAIEPSVRIVPVSDALATEIGAYILLPFFCKSLPACFGVLFLSAFANIERGFETSSFGLRYTSMSTTMLAFSSGAVLYHLKDRFACIRAPAISITIWVSHWGLWLIFKSYPWQFGLYVSVLLSMWVIISLYRVSSGRVDRFLGDLSYPVYLLHVVCGAIVILSFPAVQIRSYEYCLLTIAYTLAISSAIVIYIDRPIMSHKWKPS